METYYHEIPGRLRIRNKKIKEENENIYNIFTEIKGISRLRTNLKTGSLLIEYDKTKISSLEIINILEKNKILYIEKLLNLDRYISRETEKILNLLVMIIF